MAFNLNTQVFKPLVLMIMLFFFIWDNNSVAQLPINKININYSNLKLSSILDSLSVKMGINFSYNSELPAIKKNKSITINARLEDILKILFQGEPLEYSILDKLIIISSIANPSNDERSGTKEAYFAIKGTVLDNKTLKPLAYASVIISGKSLGTVTNNSGEFILKLPNSLRFNDSIMFSYIGYQPEYRKIETY